MNERDLIATQTIKQVSEGGDQVRADLKATASAQDQLAASSNNLATVTETSARRQTSAAAAFNALAREMDPAARAYATLERQQNTFGRAMASNSDMLDKAGQSLTVYRDKLDAAAVAAENLRRQQANSSVNLGSGFSPGTANTRTYAAEFEAAAKAQDDMVAASNRLKAALNPLAAEEARQAAELNLLKQALAAGIITQEQFASAQRLSATHLENLSQSLKTAGTAGRVMSGEMVNLGYQLNDVVTGLALGQSPFMILGQQGGQIVQIFTNSKASIADFASSTMTWLRSLITPMTAVVGGVTALAGAAAVLATQWDKVQTSSQRALIGAGERTGTSIADLNKFVSENSGVGRTTLSEKEIRPLGEELTKTGEIVISQLHGMSDAVLGFANQTGKSIEDARKDFIRFAVDPKKGLEDLAGVFGNFDAATRSAVDTLVQAGDKTAAFQAIIDALSEKSRRAAENMGALEKVWRAITTLAGKESVNPSGLESKIDAAKVKLNDAIERSTGGGPDATAAEYIGKLTEDLIKLQKEFDKSSAGKLTGELTKLSSEADAADKSIIPEIARIEELQIKIGQLERAKAAGATSKFGAERDDTALLTYRNQLAAQQQSEAAAARYNVRVKEISQSWGNVGQATALSLQAAQNQLPVIQAVGGRAKMVAQFAADYANEMDRGKSATEATALASSNLQAAQAAVNASAQEQLFSLQNQAASAGAVTGAQKIQADGQATLNALLHAGVDAATAYAVANQQIANSTAAASAGVVKQAQSVRDSTEMLRAQRDGTTAVTAANIAYRNAINSGASSQAASTLRREVMINEMEKEADRSAQLTAQLWKEAEAWENADRAANPKRGTFRPDIMKEGPLGFTTDPGIRPDGHGGFIFAPGVNGGTGGNIGGTNVIQPAGYAEALQALFNTPVDAKVLADDAIKSGNIDSAIGAVKNFRGYGDQPVVTDAVGTLQTLYGLKNSQATDNAAKITNDQEFLQWLQAQPQTVANLQAISTLTNEIKSLSQSTNSLNATNQELLSPYYEQDPRTSHIGFRSQGMASGGWIDVPGSPSSNDNMVAQIPVAGGERIFVDPNRSARGGSGNAININMPILINGRANKDEVGRTVYQNAQSAARTLRAAMS